MRIIAGMKDLKQIELFKNLTDDELKELEPYLVTTPYKKKDDIFSEGDPPEWFYIVPRAR